MFSSNSSQVSNDAVFVEDVFSTYLYTGNGSTQTITNGIDLAGKGGLVWTKKRQDVSGSTDLNHILFDTVRVSGANDFWLSTNNTNAQLGGSNYINYNSNGFDWTFGGSSWNGNTDTFASWTFRKQPKFFDVVTYTGNNATSRQIAHSLGSTPACIIVKCTNAATNWVVYHKDLSTDSGTVDSNNLVLNSTGAQSGGGCFGDDAYQTSTYFTLGRLGSGFNDTFNKTGNTYVAYLFAHNAGGFGLTGTDNVISCGSWTGTGSAQDVTLGYEPQFLIIKNATTGATNWVMLDNMRGLPVGTGDAYLKPNLSDAEVATSDFVDPTATGFRTILSTMNTSGNLYIYIAIRRGPMKVPTSGTSVFSPDYAAGTSTSGTVINANFAPDSYISKNATGSGFKWTWYDRLMGNYYLSSNNTDAQSSSTDASFTASSVGVSLSTWAYVNSSSYTYSRLSLKRAPSFYDVVCYTGTGNNNTSITHNLAVVPELIIVKDRSAVIDWGVYHQAIGQAYAIYLNQSSAAAYVGDFWGTTAFTSTTFRVGNYSALNTNTEKYVAYLFATCAGVSKVGSYTGTGSARNIDCGFTSGARMVLIKIADGNGDWYLWTSAMGITSGNDPFLLLDLDNAVDTSSNIIGPYSAGFSLTSGSQNASGKTYIYLAIA